MTNGTTISKKDGETYEFSQEIQEKIIAWLLSDEASLKIIKPELFDNPIHQALAQIVFNFQAKYHCLPSEDEFLQEVDQLLDSKARLPHDEYLDEAEKVLAQKATGDFAYIRDKLTEFAQYQAMRTAIEKSVDLLQKKRDYAGIQQLVNEAVGVGRVEEDNEELHCVVVADVAEEEVHWLMPNRVPYNELTIWGGDPGVGKSYLSLWLAAHITAGIPLETGPTVPVEQGSVIILNTEDTIANTIRKRLRFNGANLKKCLVIDSVLRRERGERLFSLTKDLNRLKKKIEEVGDVRLVIIDLLDTYLGTNIDSNKATEISAVLAPLKRFAEQNHIAILGLMHLNKNQQSSFIYRLLGSVKLIGIPRVVEFITKDRNDSQIRYFQIAKNNCTDEDWETLGFAFHKEKDGRIIIEMDAEIPPLEEQVGPETKEEVRQRHKKKEEAVAILRDLFGHDNAVEAVLVSEVKKAHPDIYPNAWGKARKEIGVRTFQKDGVWWWSLKKSKV